MHLITSATCIAAFISIFYGMVTSDNEYRHSSYLIKAIIYLFLIGMASSLFGSILLQIKIMHESAWKWKHMFKWTW